MEMQEIIEQGVFQVRQYEELAEGDLEELTEYYARYRTGGVFGDRQLVKYNGELFEIPTKEVVGECYFDQIMVPTCCGQKHNEQAYRTKIKNDFWELKGSLRGNDDDAEFLALVESQRAAKANSDAYNRVLRAAENFQRKLWRGNLQELELVSDANVLYDACEAYVKMRWNPFFKRGCDRLELVRSLQSKAEYVRTRHIKEGDVNFCVAYILERQADGRWRRAALIETVKMMISAWSCEEPPEWTEELKRCMAENNRQIETDYLPYFFPEIRKCFRDKESTQRYVLSGMEREKLTARIKKIMAALDETMDDIAFWGTRMGATSVRKVRLTGSDLHERGMGVSIVTFIVDGAEQTVIIKPDERWAEYALLGKREGSVAEELNRFAEEGKIRVKEPGGDFRLLEKKIRTIAMQVEQGHGTMVEYVKHIQVNAVRELAEQRMPAIDRQKEPQKWKEKMACALGDIVDADQILLTQIFCMLTGMEDMHRENLVYEEADGGYRAVMIDADNALTKGVLADASVALQDGIPWNYLKGKTVVIDNVEVLVNHIASELSETTVRTVPFTTKGLAKIREKMQSYENLPKLLKKIKEMDAEPLRTCINRILWAKGQIQSFEDVRYDEDCEQKITELTELLEEVGAEAVYKYNLFLIEKGDENMAGLNNVLESVTRTAEDEKNALVCAIEDFMSGLIPFYAFRPGDGAVVTHGDVRIATAKRVEDMKGVMIAAFRPQDTGEQAAAPEQEGQRADM